MYLVSEVGQSIPMETLQNKHLTFTIIWCGGAKGCHAIRQVHAREYSMHSMHVQCPVLQQQAQVPLHHI